MVVAVQLKEQSMFRTSYGHRGTLSVYLSASAVEAMRRDGFELTHKGVPVVWMEIVSTGIIRLHNGKQPNTVRRVFSKTPKGKCQCAISIAAKQVAVSDIGLPWASSEVDSIKKKLNGAGRDLSYELLPPRDEHRYPPKEQNRSKRGDTPKGPQGMLFLGTFPDGSPIDFALPMARVLELCAWLQERDIEVGYEGEFHQG